jgi:hypothetical protein
MIGRILGFDESRHILVVRDMQGNVAELKPEEGSELKLRLSLDLYSGRTLEFSVPAPPEVLSYLNEIKTARSIEELDDQLNNDLNGVEDDHDRAVKQAEGDMPYMKRKSQGLSLPEQELAESLARKISKSAEESP